MSSHEGRPDFKSPPGGCDAHFHVFGPAGRYPYNQADLRYAPPLAPVEDFLALSKMLGLERFVFVQPSAYGRDNRCMLEAMREVGTQKCRGIADIDENAPDAELERLNAAGVRGVRINVSPVKPHEAGFAAKLLPRIGRLAGRCAERYCWVKLTGVYRMSAAAGFADVAPMARALIETAPDRLIWGSDYPHLSFAEEVGSIELWNLLGKWAPDQATRRRILVDNPQALFKFRAP